MKKLLALVLALCMVFALCACGKTAEVAPAAEEAAEVAEEVVEEVAEEAAEAIVLHVDAAASMKSAFDEIVEAYKEAAPNVEIVMNTGSSGKLLTQIEESNGVDHDVFFSAGKSQVKTLNEEDGLVVEDSIVELLENQVCLVKGIGAETAVTGWENIKDAKNMALTDGGTPVGKYTRIAFQNLGYLDADLTPADITTEEVQEALGIEINECDDVGVVAAAVAEQSNEIGTVYYTDYYDFKDQLEIIAQDDGTLTGAIIYPVCLVKNSAASDEQNAAAVAFVEFLQSEQVLEIFKDHCFIIH